MPGEPDPLAASPPLPYSDWSLTPEAMRAVGAALRERGAGSVVELGCGVSTIGIARLLAASDGSLTAIEHDPAWAELVGARLDQEGLSDRARIVTGPLEPHPLATDGAAWYPPEALARLPRAIDFLLVDGPPGNEAGIELSRYPALPVLADRLLPGAAIALDDAARPGEREILARWEAEYPVTFEPAADGRLAIGDYLPAP